MTRRLWGGLLLCAAALGAQACVRPDRACGAPSDGHVTIALSSLPNTLDWSQSHESSFQNYPALLAMMQGLTTLGPDAEVQPGLAERWEVRRTADTPPREVYTFHLKPGVTWSDGRTPLSAHDFVYGWQRALLGAEPADLLDLEGARAVLAAREAGDAQALEAARAALGVRALDGLTLEVTLASPRTYFLSRVATVYTFFPQPAARLRRLRPDELPAWFNEPDGTHPLVVGEYRPLRWDRVGQRVELERNPHAPLEAPPGAVRRLTLLQAALAPVLYAQCRVDFLFQDDPAATLQGAPELARSPLMSVYWLGFNTSKVPLPVRRAIAHALDRRALLEGLLPPSRVARSFLPEPMPGALDAAAGAARFPDHDLAKAKALLAEAGEVPELTLLVRGGGTFIPETGIADAVRRQLEAVGLRVRLVTTSNFTNDVKAQDGTLRHALFLKRTGADYAHPQTLLTPFQSGGNHYTDWHKLEGGAAQARFQALLDEGAAETDPERMRALYAKTQAVLLDEQVAVVPLYFPDRYYLKRPWLRGLGVDAFNFLTLRGMRIEGAAP